MAVYIDDYNAPYGRMVMCHMMADTTDELLAMADRIGVARKWIQKPGTFFEHFDICLAKKAEAIAAGAKAVTAREMAQWNIDRRPQLRAALERIRANATVQPQNTAPTETSGAADRAFPSKEKGNSNV